MTINERIAELTQRQINCEHELAMLRADLAAILTHINNSLIEIRREVANGRGGRGSLGELAVLLEKYFSPSELADLAFATFSLDLRSIAGDTPGDTAREFVLWADRRRLVGELARRAAALRPHAPIPHPD